MSHDITKGVKIVGICDVPRLHSHEILVRIRICCRCVEVPVHNSKSVRLFAIMVSTLLLTPGLLQLTICAKPRASTARRLGRIVLLRRRTGRGAVGGVMGNMGCDDHDGHWS
jgi:hypothetical protein